MAHVQRLLRLQQRKLGLAEGPACRLRGLSPVRRRGRRMTHGRWQWRTLAGLCLALLLFCLPWQAGQAYLLPKERPALDLPDVVHDPDAPYFYVAGRMPLLTGTEDPMLLQLVNTLKVGQTC